MHFREYLRLPTPVTDIYVALSLYGIGMTLVGIFIPIYLLTLGYSITFALIHVLITKIILLFLIPITYYLDSKIGIQGTTLLRIPFFLTSFITLMLIPNSIIYFYISAITGGFALALFWVPIQTFFLHQSHTETEGSEVGKMLSIPTFFKILSPAIGGYISVLYGFNVLFVIGLFIITLSTAPLFLVKKEISKKSIIKFSKLKEILGFKMFAMTISDGFVYITAGILFPLLIFINLNAVESVGTIMSIGAVFFALTSYFVGKTLDHKSLKKYYFYGAILFALTLILRPFLTEFYQFAIIILFGGTIAAIYESSYITNFYKTAKSNSDGDLYLIARELILNLSRIFLLIIAILIPWSISFFIAAGALFITAFIIKNK